MIALWLVFLGLVAMSKAPMTVPYQTVEEGTHSGITRQAVVLATTPEAWHELFRRIHKNQMPLPVPPEPQKSEPGVYLYIGLGTRNTSGYAVKVSRVEMKEGRFTVYAAEECPPEGSATLQVITHPYVVLYLPWDAPDVTPEVEVLLTPCHGQHPDTLKALPLEQWTTK